MTKLHDRLWAVCRDTKDFHSGKDTDHHNKPDCSTGCKWFIPLEGMVGSDWGVCSCAQSPRAGLLTFEHMGCKFYKQEA